MTIARCNCSHAFKKTVRKEYFLQIHYDSLVRCRSIASRCCLIWRNKGWWRNSQALGRSSPCWPARCRHRQRHGRAAPPPPPPRLQQRGHGWIFNKWLSQLLFLLGHSMATSGASRSESFEKCLPTCSVNACACPCKVTQVLSALASSYDGLSHIWCTLQMRVSERDCASIHGDYHSLVSSSQEYQ